MKKSKGVKFDNRADKPDMSLLPFDLLKKIVRPYEYGLVKYVRNNWRKGFDTSRSLAAAMRHISEWQDRGQEYDLDAYELCKMKVHHIEMVIFNLICILDAINNHPELVHNYIPEDFKSEVPLSKEEEERIENLRLDWVNNTPIEKKK